MALAVPETAADFDIQLESTGRVEAVLSEARRLLGELGLARADGPDEEPGPRPGLGEALLGAVRAAHARARDLGEPLSLLLVAAESVPAAALSERLRRHLRGTDLIGRETPEASAVLLLLPTTDAAGAAVVAERLRRGAPAEGIRGLCLGGAATSAGGPVPPLGRLRAVAAAALATSRAHGGAFVLGPTTLGAA
jgi:hypothetical protein